MSISRDTAVERVRQAAIRVAESHGLELFDLQLDPEEMRDLTGDPGYAATIAEFESALRSMLNPEAVDRRAKDDQNALIERFGGRDAALRLGYPGETPTDQKFQAAAGS